MDLKYYKDNGNGKGEWVSLKVQSNTSVNDDSTFATPNYIINKIITKDKDNVIKYLNEIPLNKAVLIDNSKADKPSFVSNIELSYDTNNGMTTLTPIYKRIDQDISGDFVSSVSFDTETGNLKITKKDVPSSVLNPINSGLDIPDIDTAGFFYLQIDESSESEASI